jgi:hypothetical protein
MDKLEITLTDMEILEKPNKQKNKKGDKVRVVWESENLDFQASVKDIKGNEVTLDVTPHTGVVEEE